jgi:predicted AlkP superfamily pyrophosphatase or phosphodiesterase
MNPLMLPPAPKDVGRLSDVFSSALASVIGSGPNVFRLARVNHAVVILVDGLGFENLAESKGYARFLGSKLDETIRCEFPSTTATSLTGLATGMRSNKHGVIGYSAYDRASAIPMNLLTGWDSPAEASKFKKVDTISESAQGLAIRVIGPRAYEGSGFTALTMPGAEYLAAEKIEDRFSALSRIGGGKNLTYLYVPELDQLAHRFGVESVQWLNALEELDQQISNFAKKTPANMGVLVTADHGIIDVPTESHVYLDEFDWFDQAIIHTAGDPRCNFLYLRENSDAIETKRKLFEAIGSMAYVCDPEELRLSGWADWSTPEFQNYIPDLLIIWHSRAVGYDRRSSQPQHLKMIGQHGSVSDRETRVPLIRLGAY